MSMQSDLDLADVRRDMGPAERQSAYAATGALGISPALPAPVSQPARYIPHWPTARKWTHRHSVALACLATLTVHLFSVTRQLGSDEGGFAMVARHWLDGGPFLYGQQWVDRPPGLIALFDMAQRLGPYGVRLTATLLAVALVAALASAAEAVGGRSAARWAAWTG